MPVNGHFVCLLYTEQVTNFTRTHDIQHIAVTYLLYNYKRILYNYAQYSAEQIYK